MNRIPIRAWAFVLALALLLVLTGPVLAENVSGMLFSIEPDDHVFELLAEGFDLMSFRFSVIGEVFINEEARTIWDLQPGDLVTVTYEIDDEELVATTIRCFRN